MRFFARVNDKPRIVEEHDGWSGVFSAVSAGTGVALDLRRVQLRLQRSDQMRAPDA